MDGKGPQNYLVMNRKNGGCLVKRKPTVLVLLVVVGKGELPSKLCRALMS